MKHLLLSLFFLLASFGLSAQCADFTLVSVQCGPGDGETLTLSATPPVDWFGESNLYIKDLATQDTVGFFPIAVNQNMVVNTLLGVGNFEVILTLEGLCSEAIFFSLPNFCNFSNNSGSVSGRTWFDENRDGLRQDSEEPVPSTVFLEDGNGNPLQVINTGTNGTYDFVEAPTGIPLQVRFEPVTDDILLPTQVGVGSDPARDNDMRADFRTLVFELIPDGNATSLDAGFTSCNLSVALDDAEVMCNAACEGELQAEVAGGTAPYTYEWSASASNQTTARAVDLCTGQHSVTVTDANGCSVPVVASIVETSDLEITFATSPATCGDACDGAVDITVTGGIGSYTYIWVTNGDPVASSEDLVDICAGLYEVIVTDTDGCSVSAFIEVEEVSDLEVIAQVTQAVCGDTCNGEINLSVTGGTAPYVFDWSHDNLSVNLPQVVVCPGQYSVTVTDAVGCSVVNSYTIILEGTLPNFPITTVDALCNGDNNGSLFIDLLTYENLDVFWDNGVVGPLLLNAPAGTYCAFISDGSGCQTTVCGTIEEQSAIVITFDVQNVTVCEDECNGFITPTITGGVPPYTFEWSDGSTASTCPQACAGGYALTVTDSNGCVDSTAVIVTGPPAIVATIERSGGDCDPDGGPFSAIIVATGGTEPYDIVFTADGVDYPGPGFPDLPPFTVYDITVTSADGCSEVLTGRTRELVRNIPVTTVPFYVPSCNTTDDLPFTSLGGEDVIINPAGDTVLLGEPQPVVSGEYQFVSTSEDETCREITSQLVTVVDFPDDLDLSYSTTSNCGEYGCIQLEGNLDLLFLTDITVTVTLPSGDVFASTFEELCQLDQPGVYTVTFDNGCEVRNFSVDVQPTDPCGSVSGVLYSTPNQDCTPVPDAQTIPFTIIRLTETTTGDVFFSFTDDFGAYTVPVPAGTYEVEPRVNNQDPVYACETMLVTVTGTQSETVDLYSPGELMCPEMDVDICIWQQRRCFENTMYLYYYNAGNILAPNAVLTVELDEYYTDISADAPFTQVGQILTFDLGDVAFCEFGYIAINFTISCDAPLGETHCVNASITPDGFCEPAPAWNGSLVNITEAVCDGDSIRFTVANLGINPMTVPLSYVVVEDGIMMTTQPIIGQALDALETMEIAVAAEGSLYHLITNQAPNAPTTNDPTMLVDACGNTNLIPGLSNILALGNGVPWQHTICLENSGSWDPNDKTGYPTGHTGNMIKSGTRLDYNIRFQNTGTDTAFTVVIRDTIGEALDLSSFRIGASSHRYRMSIDTNRALTFTFDNIQLPDSTTDLAGSNGMITFSIDHNPTLEPGDLIENQAAIYFDFNEPVITNISTHMIEIMGLPTSLRTLLAKSTTIDVFPNPVSDVLSIRVPDGETTSRDVFVVTDLYGRDLRRLPAPQREQGMPVADLPNGYYFLTLLDGAGRAKGRTGFVVAR